MISVECLIYIYNSRFSSPYSFVLKLEALILLYHIQRYLGDIQRGFGLELHSRNIHYIFSKFTYQSDTSRGKTRLLYFHYFIVKENYIFIYIWNYCRVHSPFWLRNYNLRRFGNSLLKRASHTCGPCFYFEEMVEGYFANI